MGKYLDPYDLKAAHERVIEAATGAAAAYEDDFPNDEMGSLCDAVMWLEEVEHNIVVRSARSVGGGGVA